MLVVPCPLIIESGFTDAVQLYVRVPGPVRPEADSVTVAGPTPVYKVFNACPGKTGLGDIEMTTPLSTNDEMEILEPLSLPLYNGFDPTTRTLYPVPFCTLEGRRQTIVPEFFEFREPILTGFVNPPVSFDSCAVKTFAGSMNPYARYGKENPLPGQ